MGQLIVRNIEDEVIRELKTRAARKGHSAEAEHREILREVLTKKRPRKTFEELLLEMPPGLKSSDLRRPRDRGRKVKL